MIPVNRPCHPVKKTTTSVSEILISINSRSKAAFKKVIGSSLFLTTVKNCSLQKLRKVNTGIIKTKLSGKSYAFFKSLLKKKRPPKARNIIQTGITNPVVKKSLNSLLFNLKKSTLVDCTIPNDKKGIRIKTELVSKLSKPFS